MNLKKFILDTFSRININHVYFCDHCNQCYLARTLLKKNDKRVCPACEKEVKIITDSPLGKAYFAFVRPDLPYEKDSSSV